MNRRLLPLLAAAASLAITPAASAGIWSWTGTFSSTNPHTGPCNLVAFRAGASLLRLELLEYERRQQRRG
jgi:hypothetical protein